MNIKSILNFKRVFFLIRNEILSNYTKILTVFGLIAGILFVNIFFSRFYQSASDIYNGWYGKLLLIGGLIYSSNIFKDIHDPQKGIYYMTIPASITEKFIAKLFLVSIGYSVWVVLFYFIFTSLMSVLCLVLSGQNYALFNPFTAEVFRISLNYIIIQSVFLLGSVYFKRSAFFKTSLVLLAVFILISLAGLSVLRIIFNDFYRELFAGGNLNLNFSDLTGYFNSMTTKYLPMIGKIIYFLTAPLFWTASYFRLKETEV